jgi:hypothetical protein
MNIMQAVESHHESLCQRGQDDEARLSLFGWCRHTKSLHFVYYHARCILLLYRINVPGAMWPSLCSGHTGHWQRGTASRRAAQNAIQKQRNTA